MCYGFSKEPSHGDGSFEYPLHVFSIRNNENNFPIHTLIWRPDLSLFKMFMLAYPVRLGLSICLTLYAGSNRFPKLQSKQMFWGTQKNRLNETVLLGTHNII